MSSNVLSSLALLTGNFIKLLIRTRFGKNFSTLDMNAVTRKKRGFDFVEYKLNALVGMHINKYKEIENRSNWTQS